MDAFKSVSVSEKFAITLVAPPDYPHILGLIEVAEALHFGLLELGIDSIVTANLNEPGRRPVLLGANLLAKMPPVSVNPEAIIFNLEQMDPDSVWLEDFYLDLLRSHEVWDYSERNIAYMQERNIGLVRHVSLGYVPQLSRIVRQDEDIDVLFYGSMNQRRQVILDALEAQGLKVVRLFGVYGQERDALIARSKVVLNIHFYESKIFEIVRIFYLLANQVCVVSESGPDPMEDAFSTGLALVSYDNLVKTCIDLAADPERRQSIAQSGFRLIRDKPQSAILKQALFETMQLKPGQLDLPSKLNLGSGKDSKEDFLNMDINPAWNPDVIHDISQAIPPSGLYFKTRRFGDVHLQEGHFDLIQAFDVLEHVNDLVMTMTNCLALLKEGGIFRINVPYDLSYGAWQDPTHVRAFNEKSWLYYTDWFWYLGWNRWRFELASLQYMLSPAGEALHKKGEPVEKIAAVPRAVDSMLVELKKRRLTPSEMEMVSQVQPGPALACTPVKAPLLEPEPVQARLVLVGLSVVRNEGDVIESFVRHNLRFLDALLIVDNGSVDGTREILVQLQREGLSVVVQDDPLFGHFQSRRMSQLCRQACLVFSPDYLFALDADEFIMAPTRAALEEELGHLPSGHHGVLAWSTYVYQPVQDGQYPASTLARMIFRRQQETPGYYKVVVSGAIDPETVEIAEGNHSVSQTDKTSLSHTLLSGVRLAHFPVRSSRQLSCKILSGWLANLSKNPDIAKTSEAWHWHALYDRLKQNPCLTEDELAVISLNYAQSTGYTRVDDTVIVADPFAVGFVHQYDHLYVDSLPSVLTNMMEQLVLGQTSSMVFPEYQDLMRRLNLDTALHIGQDEAAWVNQLRQIGFNRVSYLDVHCLTGLPTGFSFCLSENIALEESFDCLICDAGEGEFDLSQWRDTLKNLLPCISKCILFYSVKEPSTTFQVWTDIGWYLHPFYTRIVRFLKSDALPVRYAWVLVPTVS